MCPSRRPTGVDCRRAWEDATYDSVVKIALAKGLHDIITSLQPTRVSFQTCSFCDRSRSFISPHFL
jgi:hypothetical protein